MTVYSSCFLGILFESTNQNNYITEIHDVERNTPIIPQNACEDEIVT